jgi:hypothetical protein
MGNRDCESRRNESYFAGIQKDRFCHRGPQVHTRGTLRLIARQGQIGIFVQTFNLDRYLLQNTPQSLLITHLKTPAKEKPGFGSSMDAATVAEKREVVVLST